MQKEHNNPYDNEAIKVTMKTSARSAILQIRRTPKPTAQWAPAQSINMSRKIQIRVMFMTSTKIICEVIDGFKDKYSEEKPNRQTKLKKKRLLSFDYGTGVHRTSVGNNTNYGFNFERIACNRVHCTRTGEQLQYHARV